MHEMGIAEKIVEIALASIPEDVKDPKIEKMNLRIGKFASVVEDSLRFCFSIIVKDTPLEDTKLIIKSVPVLVHCNKCGTEWEVDNPIFTCPECEANDLEMLSGREIDIDSIELAD
ncbi:MAG: hydrogenase maturation nickel metallochaperone HypA [Desulfobacteraceae bacterium]|nr:hydrogenase maturation nickel metallochaperone HypA [Desulfobacteraceae bacterium]